MYVYKDISLCVRVCVRAPSSLPTFYGTYRQVLQFAIGNGSGLLVLEGLLISEGGLRVRLRVAQFDLQRFAQTACRLQVDWSAELQWANATQVLRRGSMQQVCVCVRVGVAMQVTVRVQVRV